MDAKLNLSLRDRFGSKAKSLVNEGNAIGNIFGKGMDSVAVFGKQTTVEKVVAQAGKNHPIEVELDDGSSHLVLVNEVERDHITRKIHHVSFMVIKRGVKTTAEVPVHQTGESPAAKTGLIVVTLMDRVEIEAIPSKIPEELTISVESLVEDGDQVSLKDIIVPEDVEIKADLEQTIAKVERPRSQVEAESEDDEEVDPAAVPSDHGTESSEEDKAE